MFNERRNVQTKWEMVNIEDLVPQNHLLRKIDKYIDFSFIYEKVRPYYSMECGRPSIDPVMLFKMMMIGYIYGIRSERQLEQEIQTNVAYRWFLGLGLTDPVPDHTTISFNRHGRFKDTTVFQDVFDAIVEQAMAHRMVGGRILMTDSTHLKANANKNRFNRERIKASTQVYLSDLTEAVNQDREEEGKKS